MSEQPISTNPQKSNEELEAELRARVIAAFQARQALRSAALEGGTPVTTTPVPVLTTTPVPVLTTTPVPVPTTTPVPTPSAPKEKRKREEPPRPGGSRVVTTSGASRTQKEKVASREARFKTELDTQRKEDTAAQIRQQDYFDDFDGARRTVTTTGSWLKHYNTDNENDATFTAYVDGGRWTSLADFIEYVVQRAGRSCMSFAAPDPSYRGQLSIVTIDLAKFFRERNLKDMYVTGGVTRTGVDVFHAGPGGV
jgi:hypothetical protein